MASDKNSAHKNITPIASSSSLIWAPPSNYPCLFSDSSQFHSHFSDLNLKISTDFITISIKIDCHEQLFEFLHYLGYQTIQDGYDNGPTYRRRRFVKHVMYPQMSIGISYKRYSYMYNRPAISLTLFRPTKTLIQCLDQFLIDLGITANVSKVELPLDFSCIYHEDLYDFLCKQQHLKNQRKSSFYIKSTFYSNDLRSGSRGTRLYIKRIGNDLFVRFELVLGQGPLRKYNVNWPPYNIDDIDIFKILSFVRFDTDYLHNLLRKYYDSVSASDPVSDEIISEVIDHLLSIPVLQAVDFLKHNNIPNYGRTLKTLDWFHDWLIARMRGQSFLPVGGPM